MTNSEKNTINSQNSASINIIGENLGFAGSEAYKLLRTNVMFSIPGDEGECRIVAITSSVAGEGKSTTSLNLAYSLAEAGKKTVFIEADMRLPILAKRYGYTKSPGLSNLLAGFCDYKSAIQSSTIHKKLALITSGDIPPNPSELLASNAMEQTLEWLSKQCDYIVIDLPPVELVTDALTLVNLVNGYVMVVRQDYTDRKALDSAMKKLSFAGAKLLGFAFTHANDQKRRRYKYKYSYSNKYEGSYDYQSSYQKASRKARMRDSGERS